MLLFAYLRLTRLPLLVLGVLASFAVVSMCGQLHTTHAQLAILIASLVNITFNVYNEICDIKTDSILKPYKPLPSGKVSMFTAFAIFYTLLATSLVLIGVYASITLNVLAVIIAFLGIIFSYLYDKYGKTTGVLGNFILMMPYTFAILFILADCGLLKEYWLFPIAFGVTTFSFNILTLWQDMEGDGKAGLYTAPMQLGSYNYSISIYSVVLSIILYVLTPIPPLSKLAFIVTSFSVGFGASSILLNKPVLVEWFCRRFGRLLLMLSFFMMLLGK